MTRLLRWLADLPTTALVVLTGLLLAVTTGVRYLFTAWDPGDHFEEWLLFVFAVITGSYAAKRATFKSTPPNGPDVEDVPAVVAQRAAPQAARRVSAPPPGIDPSPNDSVGGIL